MDDCGVHPPRLDAADALFEDPYSLDLGLQGQNICLLEGDVEPPPLLAVVFTGVSRWHRCDRDSILK